MYQMQWQNVVHMAKINYLSFENFFLLSLSLHDIDTFTYDTGCMKIVFVYIHKNVLPVCFLLPILFVYQIQELNIFWHIKLKESL